MMKTIIRQATIPYTTEQMYDLINDIARYPEFIPNCIRAEVFKASPTMMEAKLCFKKGPIHQNFTTRNTLTPHQRIHMQLVDGPFKMLQGSWDLQALANSDCHLALKLEFAFKNALLDMSLGPFFQQLGSELVDCFAKRAHVIYGK